jgi:hypothetical protein
MASMSLPAWYPQISCEQIDPSFAAKLKEWLRRLWLSLWWRLTSDCCRIRTLRSRTPVGGGICSRLHLLTSMNHPWRIRLINMSLLSPNQTDSSFLPPRCISGLSQLCVLSICFNAQHSRGLGGIYWMNALESCTVGCYVHSSPHGNTLSSMWVVELLFCSVMREGLGWCSARVWALGTFGHPGLEFYPRVLKS